MCSLGLAFELGEGLTPNPANAVYWYKKAAEAGYLPAMTNLAVCCLNGTGTERSPEEAARWLEQAAEQDFPRARGSWAIFS